MKAPDRRALFLAVPLLAGAGACGGGGDSAPADVHGGYTVSITNGPSTCPIQGWTPGTTSQGIPVSFTQNGANVTAAVGGAGGVYLGAITGGTTFQGTVTGSSLGMSIKGSRPLSSGTCAFTIDAKLEATSSGDVIQGTVSYVPNTNTSPDCAAIAGCTARQDFNGTRPPSSPGG